MFNNTIQSTQTFFYESNNSIHERINKTKQELIYNALKSKKKQIFNNYENEIFAIPARKHSKHTLDHSSDSSTCVDSNEIHEDLEYKFNTHTRQCNSPFEDMDFEDSMTVAFKPDIDAIIQDFQFQKPTITKKKSNSDKEINYYCLNNQSTEKIPAKNFNLYEELNNKKGNDLILSRIAEFRKLILRHLTAKQNEDFYALANKMCQYVEYLGSDLKGVSSTSIVHSILI